MSYSSKSSPPFSVADTPKSRVFGQLVFLICLPSFTSNDLYATLLSQRRPRYPTMPSTAAEPRSPSLLASQPVRSRYLRLLQTVSTLTTWYCISSAIILTTKWLFTNYFAFPLTVTSYSNTLTTVWAFLFSRHPQLRPQPLTRKQFREYVLPIGISTALEIGFSNIALKLLTVSFGTILKGGAPIFTMLWGLLFRVETFSIQLFLSLATIAGGITLASIGEGDSFAITGFILQLLATCLGGLRWAMTHVLLKGSSSDAMDPLTATLYTSPTTALCVLPFALALEGSNVWNRLVNQSNPGELPIIFGTMTMVATLVFTLLISEYWLVNATSSLALSVAGVFKELLTIGGGVILFSDHISFLNGLGFVVCQLGIFAYIFIRYEPDHDSHPYTPAPQDEITDALVLAEPLNSDPIPVPPPFIPTADTKPSDTVVQIDR